MLNYILFATDKIPHVWNMLYDL